MIWIVELLGGAGFFFLGFIWVGFPETIDRWQSTQWEEVHEPTESNSTDMRLAGLGFLVIGAIFVLQAFGDIPLL